MGLLLGLDIGTTTTKAVLIDHDGRLLGVDSASHPLTQPAPGWSEQNPEDWWSSTVAAVRRAVARAGVDAAEVEAVGLSGQMHGSVLLGEPALHGGSRVRALRPAILWNDQRTAAECLEIEARAGGREALVGLVGNAALTGFTLPKLLWVRRHEPGLFKDVRRVLLPKDYVRLCLTGRCATDVGDAAGTLLLDVERREWSPRMLELFGLDAAMLPPILESAAPAGALTPAAAEETGLRAGIPVMAGSGDNQAGAVGAGVVEPGVVLCALGTSGVVFAHSGAPRKDKPGRLHTMPAATGDARARGGWCNTGVMLSAAGSLQWVRDALFPRDSFEELMSDAEAAPAGCDGLIFLPYLTGERCPYPDPEARGGWIGLTSRHTRGHLVRAVIEGVSFAMGQIVGLVRSVGVPVTRIRLGGGGARSTLWRQIMADVCGAPVEVPNTEEGPAFGAALLAGVGVGVWPGVTEACQKTIAVTERRDPGPDVGRYQGPRLRYDALYPALKGLPPASEV